MRGRANWSVRRRQLMKFSRYVAMVGVIGGAIGTSYLSLQAAQGGPDALKKAGVAERLVDRTVSHVPKTGTAPSFVVDPGWPKPLPHNWIIGDIGGLFVDRHDHIWVYHRPRALVSSDAGALGVAGKDQKGNPVSALGHPRPYGQFGGCC